ncbi:hypothetical protein [Novosphingobium sp. HII-3]|uniref:hypothetical protein n=1 Tax=Novosphingobium sp. HII-3 TaxID=2075565 RepID=UPI000CDA4B42|nr:hypothetical protein [Novosphingobium sp. HII-3]
MNTTPPPMDGRWILAYDPSLSEFRSSRPWVLATRSDDGFHDEEGNAVEVAGWEDLPEPRPKDTGWTPPSGTIHIREVTGEGWTSNGKPVTVNWRWSISVEKPDGSHDQYRDTDFAVTHDEAMARAMRLQAKIRLPIVTVPLSDRVAILRPGTTIQ